MEPVKRVDGTAVPLDRADVDTDQIIPKQFLKRTQRTGYGDFLFYDWRFRDDGSPDPEFILNRPEYEGARVLLAGRNFGCGSSREHAPWALRDYGFGAVVAPSLADIFRSNCFQIGLVPVELPESALRSLMERAREEPQRRVTVDVEELEVRAEDGWAHPFELDPFRRTCLLNGWDDIDLTLRHEEEIRAFEEETGRHGEWTKR